MKDAEVYLYGMVLVTNSFLLKGEYPKADTYGEIKEKFRLPGGETGTCATVLNSLGVSVRMDGNHIGTNVYPVLEEFYKDKQTDLSPLFFDKNYDGLEDYVIIDKETRTPFGMFGSYYSSGKNQWNMPKEEYFDGVKVAAIDPFFGKEAVRAAEICVEKNIPYVTIDCAPDSYLHMHSAVSVISGEYIHGNCPEGTKRESLFGDFAEKGSGLTIITNGSKPFFYGRKETGMKIMNPFNVDVVSTLGAGDTFKAGCTYALLQGMNDDALVRFATACSAIACTKFPLPLNPPTLDAIQNLLK